jgi:hypothetical protein
MRLMDGSGSLTGKLISKAILIATRTVFNIPTICSLTSLRRWGWPPNGDGNGVAGVSKFCNDSLSTVLFCKLSL